MASNNGRYNAGHDDSRRSDLAVLEANEYKQKRRLERILDAIDTIDESANRAKEQFVDGEITRDGRNITVQNAVKDAIWVCWNLLKQHDQDCRRRYRNATEDADDETEIDVPDRSRYFAGGDGPIATIPQVQSDDIAIYGLRDFFDLPELWEESWFTTAKERGMPPESVEQNHTHTVPERVSWRVAIRLKEFLHDVHDLEVQFEALEDQRPYDDWREEFETGVYHGPDTVDLPHKDV